MWLSDSRVEHSKAKYRMVDSKLRQMVFIYIYNGILLSHKKEQNRIIWRDVGGPGVCQTREASQKEKNKYCILMHIYGV